jgi:uncharacterized protein YndB with AHSA1/START domain
MDGTVTEVDPPRALAYSWGPDDLRFELRPSSDGCVLIFTHTFTDTEGIKAARDGAGWHVCLDNLAARLDDRPRGEDFQAHWQDLHREYVAAMGGRVMSHEEAVKSGQDEFERLKHQAN